MSTTSALSGMAHTAGSRAVEASAITSSVCEASFRPTAWAAAGRRDERAHRDGHPWALRRRTFTYLSPYGEGSDVATVDADLVTRSPGGCLYCGRERFHQLGCLVSFLSFVALTLAYLT